jgi:hypothetical protein
MKMQWKKNIPNMKEIFPENALFFSRKKVTSQNLIHKIPDSIWSRTKNFVLSWKITKFLSYLMLLHGEGIELILVNKDEWVFWEKTNWNTIARIIVNMIHESQKRLKVEITSINTKSKWSAMQGLPPPGEMP